MKRLLAGLALASALVLGGCGSKEEATPKTAAGPLDTFVGKWEGGSKESYALTVEKDGQFKVEIEAGGQKHTVLGDASVKDKLLLLTATQIDGKPPETESDKKPEEMAISADGRTLTPVKGGASLTRTTNQITP